MSPRDRFDTLPFSVAGIRIAPVLGFAIWQQARRDTRPNRVHFRCGLAVRLPLLPTPPRGDAVTFGYKPESVYLKRTCTFLTKHTYRRTATGSASAGGVLIFHLVVGRSGAWHIARRCGIFTSRVTCTS